MAKGKKVDADIVELICDMAKGGDTPRLIAQELNLPTTTVYNILERNGLHERKEGVKKSSRKSKVKCPKCKALGHLPGARFCYKCGADIRDEGDILIERLSNIWEVINMVPSEKTDEVIKVINDVNDYIRRHK
ncbi:MAG: hypothetical protein IJK60_05710 [Clostridia bacterium]|nr:hypothetical protein [Clostridia bacterium]